jgi:predicted exporter
MQRRRLALAAWLAVVALCILQLANTRFVADLSSFLPSSPTPEQRVLVDQLRDGAISRVMLIAIEGEHDVTRARLSQTLAAALRADARFASVANGTATGFEKERDLLLANRYALSPRVTPERFTAAGLREAVGDTLDLLASSAGMMVRSLVPRDPTAEFFAVLDQMRPPQEPSLVEGVWTSGDRKRALLVARTRASGSDTDAQAEALAALEAAFAQAAKGTSARLLVTGPGVFSVRSRAMIEADVKQLSGIAIGLIAALLLVAYRSPRALALGMVPVATGAIVGIACVSLGFGAVHGITVGFGTTLIGEAVDYSIYLFVQSEGSERDWLERFWPTIRLGVLTSIAGFSAMVFSGLSGLAQLGVYSITGLIAAALVTRFVLPAMLPAGFRVRDLSPWGERVAAFAAVLSRARWLVAVVAVAAAGVIAMYAEPIFDRELSSLNPIPATDRRIDAELRESIGASDARFIIAVRAPSLQEALQAAERVGQRLDALVAAGKLGGYESPARYLPSEATQRARLASIPDEATLRARLREALADSPLRADRLEPFIADAMRARQAAVVLPAQVRGTALEIALDGFMLQDREGGFTALVGLQAAGTGTIDASAVRAAIDAAAVPGTVLVDVKGEVDRMYAGYFQRALAASAAGLLAIVALLFVALRSPARVLRVVLPLAAGVLLAAAVQLLMGSRLSLLHLVGLLLVVAIGSNYSLFFEQMRGRHDRTFASLLLANLTTVTAFGVLGFSSIPVLQAIGSTVAIGALATLLFSAMLWRPRA